MHRFRLTGTESNRDGIGASVRIYYGGQSSSRMVRTGSSYLSQSELPVTFGLGKRDSIDRAVIRWPNGRITRRWIPDTEREITLEQPK